MTSAEIRAAIIDILETIAPDEDLTNLDDAKEFRDQMELDSMDFLDIVMELRKRYRVQVPDCLLYTSPSPRDGLLSRMPSSA